MTDQSRYECNRDRTHTISMAYQIICPTCIRLYGESSVRALPEKKPAPEFGRIDFTYWPLTNEVEWHGHPPDDLTGETAPTKVTLAMVKGALAALTEAAKPKPKPSAPSTTFRCR